MLKVFGVTGEIIKVKSKLQSEFWILEISWKEKIKNKIFVALNPISTVGYEDYVVKKLVSKFEQDPTVNEEVMGKSRKRSTGHAQARLAALKRDATLMHQNPGDNALKRASKRAQAR